MIIIILAIYQYNLECIPIWRMEVSCTENKQKATAFNDNSLGEQLSL